MHRSILRTLGALLLIGAVATALLYRDQFHVAALETWVNGAGAAAPLIFIGLYALATVLFLPGAVLTLAGGALFGPLWGTLYNLLGATLGAALAFLIALICRTDRRSAKAAALLAGLGFGQVQVIQGGMTAWRANGWPVEQADAQAN